MFSYDYFNRKVHVVDAIGNGWKLNADGNLEPVMCEKDAAPLEVRNPTHLYCGVGDCATSLKCHCVSSGLQCTEFCKSAGKDCPNVITFNVADNDCDSDSDSED